MLYKVWKDVCAPFFSNGMGPERYRFKATVHVLFENRLIEIKPQYDDIQDSHSRTRKYFEFC